MRRNRHESLKNKGKYGIVMNVPSDLKGEEMVFYR